MRRLISISLAASLAACTMTPTLRVEPGFSRDASNAVTYMLLVVHDEGSLKGLINGDDQLNDIDAQVKQILVRAGYRVSAPSDLGLKNDDVLRLLQRKQAEGIVSKGYSHLLEIRVWPAQQGSTPRGFSMTLGDSDPRSRGFQRAEVVPIFCALVNVKGIREEASLRENNPLLSRNDRLYLNPANRSAHMQVLVDGIASACHTLLAELQIGPQAVASEPVRPASGLRLETVPASDSTKERLESAPPASVPDKDSAPVPPPLRSSDKAEEAVSSPVPMGENTYRDATPTAEETLPKEAGKMTNTTVSTERSSDRDGRKQIKVFNQGNTLILEFGPNRR